MGLAGIAGSLTNENFKIKLSGNFLFNPVFLLLSGLSALVVFYFMVYIMSGELLTPRANNLILVYFLLIVLASCYSYGLRFDSEKIIIYRISRNSAVQLFLIFLIITSSFMNSTLVNAFTSVIHGKIMKQRKNAIAASIQDNRHSVVLRPYAEDFDSLSKKMAPSFLQKPLKRRISGYTNWMNYQDPLADTAGYIHYYAEYNNMDTINYNGIDYIRIGLLKKK